jgi:hypothetical protein
MAEDNVNNAMIFEILKNIQATQAAMAKDIDMIKMRMTALDSHFAAIQSVEEVPVISIP